MAAASSPWYGPAVWRIRRHLNLFVDGELAGLATQLRRGAVIRVVPAVSGG